MPTYTRTGEGSASVENTSGRMVEVNPGESIETYKILGAGWDKTDDEPYHAIGVTQSITSPGTIENLLEYPYLRIIAGAAGITVKANTTTNPNTYPLQNGVALTLENEGRIDSLIFTGAGAVSVVGLYEI